MFLNINAGNKQRGGAQRREHALIANRMDNKQLKAHKVAGGKQADNRQAGAQTERNQAAAFKVGDSKNELAQIVNRSQECHRNADDGCVFAGGDQLTAAGKTGDDSAQEVLHRQIRRVKKADDGEGGKRNGEAPNVTMRLVLH